MHEEDAELPEGFTWEEGVDEPRPGWLRLVLTTLVVALVVGLLLGAGGMIMLAFL